MKDWRIDAFRLKLLLVQISEGRITNQSPEYLQLQKQLELILSDRRIALLVIAALRLDEDLAKRLIPTKTTNTVDQVSFEEIVQSLSESSLNVFSEFVLNRAKPGDESQLGPFTKCVFRAILKKAHSNIP